MIFMRNLTSEKRNLKLLSFISQSGTFISIYGLESWLLTLICSGMSPWNGFLFTVFQSIVLGPLRFAAFAFQWHFRSVVKKCAEQRKMAAETNQKS